MYYLLKRNILNKDSYFLYKAFLTKDEIAKELQRIDDRSSCRIIEGHELDFKIEVTIDYKKDSDITSNYQADLTPTGKINRDVKEETHRKMDYEK